MDDFLLDLILRVNLKEQDHKVFLIKGSGKPAKEEAKKDINNKKYYETLGVDSKATEAEIKKAFRRKALKEHPDKGGDQEKVRINSLKNYHMLMKF